MTANKLTIKPVEEEYCYRYLGQDGNKTVFRTNNKNSSLKEYYHMKSIWLSEQSGQNQIKASNSSVNTVVTANLVITLTVEVIYQSVQKLNNIDIIRKNSFE